MQASKSSKKRSDKGSKSTQRKTSQKSVVGKPPIVAKTKQKSLFVYENAFPEVISDILDSMDENQIELKKLIGKGIKIHDFVSFESKCEELLGIEINHIIEYFSHSYVKPKDKFVISFEDFIDLTQKWADSHLQQPQLSLVEEEESDPFEEFKTEMQIRNRDNLVLKFDKHSEKIQEIFEKYAGKEVQRESKGETEFPVLNVKLKYIPEIMDDLSYLTSIAIIPFKDHHEGKISKKCSKEAIDALILYLCKRVHQSSINQLRKSGANTSIYKQSTPDKLGKSKKESSNKNVPVRQKEENKKQEIDKKTDEKEKAKTNEKKDKSNEKGIKFSVKL